MKKNLSLILAIAMLASCGKDEKKATKVENTPKESVATTAKSEVDTHINVAPFRWVEGMDPGKSWDGYNSGRFLVGEPIITLNKNLEIECVLAESYKQIDDVTYEFKIRDGIKFTNGNPLTAGAVKASIERTLKLNERGSDAKIDTITAEGNILTIKTKEPFSTFLNNLTEPMYSIIDVTDIDEVDTKPVATGPYYVTAHVPEERIELAVNENYWGKVPTIKTITIKNINHHIKVDAILSGDIDVAQGPTLSTVVRMKNNSEGAKVVAFPGARETDIVLNTRKGHPLSDLALRQAISYAINRDAIAKVAGNGYARPINGPFPKAANYGFDRVKGQQYDVVKSKEILKNNGYVDTDGDGYVELKDGKIANFNLEFEPNLVGTVMPEAIQDMLKNVGIKITLAPMETSSYDPTEHINKDMTIDAAFPVILGDGQKFMNNGFSTGGSENYGGYSNPEYDALMAKLAGTFDPKERMDIFVKAQQHIIDNVANVWLFAPDDVTLVSSGMENVVPHPLNYYFVTTDWSIKK